MELKILKPDDWHLHVRDGDIMRCVIIPTARQFGRAIIMPNLVPPVTTVAQADQYYQAIRSAIRDSLPGSDFEPLMTLYLTDNTAAAELAKAADSKLVHAVKYYPAGATTNSDSGVTRLENVYSLIEHMQKLDIPLLMHGEVTDPEVDVFDREAVFIERHLEPLLKTFPQLRVVLEHVSTRDGVEFVQSAGDNVAATITPQHMSMNRNALFAGGLRPHHYCLPVLKQEQHRAAVFAAATSGNPKFFLGTDSAPHLSKFKESSCGCAGIYSAPLALGLYAEAFESAGALDRLEGFASLHGADFYRLPRNTETITLVKQETEIPSHYDVNGEALKPVRAGETVAWAVK